MADTSEEFWKTLYNWLSQGTIFERYILHTTCHFSKRNNSQLRKFNRANIDQKLELIHKIDFGFSEESIASFSFSKINLEIIKNYGVDNSLIESLSKVKGKKEKSELVEILNSLDVSDTNKNLVIKHCKNTSDKQYKIWNYARFVKSINHKKLKEILSKIELSMKQEKDTELIASLSKHSVFRGRCKNIEDIMGVIQDNVAGVIFAQVANVKKWEISNVQFYNIINSAFSKFFNENYRPSFEKYLKKNPDTNEVKKYTDSVFVEELNKIECKDAEIKIALVDYWKTAMVLDEELTLNPTFVEEEYEPYKNGIVHKKLIDKKITLDKHPDASINIANSRNFYRDAKGMSFQSVGKINSLPYFAHGTMHNIVEDETNDFKWLIDD